MFSKDIINEINKIKVNLSLESEDFKILSSSDCAVYWDGNIAKYIVELNRNNIDFFLIHEFGHVYLSKITNYPYFVKFTSEIEKVNQKIELFFKMNPIAQIEDLPSDLRDFKIIHNYSNSILDCFVNYRTFIIKKDYYGLYLDYIKEILNSIKQGFRPGKLRILLPIYINFYIEFNYHLRERFQNQKILDNFLYGLKNVILISREYNIEQFNLLEKTMDKYFKVRNTDDYLLIINFIQEILIHSSLWDKKNLKDILKIIFPII